MLPSGPVRLPRTVLSCLLTTLSMVAAPTEGETVRQPFAVTVSVEVAASQTGPDNYTVKAGSEVFIKVHLTNTSKRRLSMGYDQDSRTGVDFFHQK